MNNIISELFDSNCISNGIYSLKNGSKSRFYYNLKNLISYPDLLSRISDKIYKLLPDFDIICAIPYGAMPIATCISIKYNKPMIFVRDKPKSYGMTNLIEGEYKSTSRCVILDDVMTTGGSINEIYNILKDKMKIVDVAIVVDRQLHNNILFNYKSLINKNDIMNFLLYKYITDKKSNICFSADIPDPSQLLDILDSIGKHIIICKLHIDMINFDNDNNFIENLMKLANKHQFLLMEDRKFADISYIVEKQYDKIKNWADLVTVHGSVNPEVLKSISGIFLVSNMSNNTFNYDKKCIDMCKKYDNKIIGFVTQNRINYNNKLSMTPGISNTHKNIADQKYRTIDQLDTDIAVIGRAIYNSDDPLLTVTNLLENINK